MKSALVLLAPGCEEMEAVITVDTLRRAGVNVTVAGLFPGEVIASRDVRLLPDTELDALPDAKEMDMLVLPGGIPGTDALRQDPRVRDLLVHYLQQPEKTVGIICAAARVLDTFGLLEGRTFTCYPALAGDIKQGTHVDQTVVEDGPLISSQGPATAMAFALALVKRLCGGDVAKQVADGLLFKG